MSLSVAGQLTLMITRKLDVPALRLIPLLLLLVLLSANQYLITDHKFIILAAGKRPESWAHCSSIDTIRYNLVFYMHDLPVSSDPSSVPVAGRNLTTNPGLGLIVVFDDVLTDGPSLSDSTILGAGQGTYIFASRTSPDLLLVFTAVFRGNSSFNGSTLSFHGSDRILLPVREIAVVGGTGRFRLARGVAAIETASRSGINAVLKFNVSIVTM